MDVLAYEESVLQPRPLSTVGEPAWLSAFREKAYVRFQQTGFPTRKMEAWKYMSLEPVLKMPIRSVILSPQDEESKKQILRTVGAQDDKEGTLIFWNGVYDSSLSSFCGLPSEVQAGLLSSGRFDSLGIESVFEKDLEKEENSFALINAFQFRDAFVFWVPAGMVLPEPVRLRFHSEDSAASYPRIVLMLEAGAKAEVIFDFDGKAADALVDGVVQIRLAPNSNLHLTQVQRGGAGSIQFLNTQVRQAEGSSFESVSFSNSGKMIRNETVAHFDGENAWTSFFGLALLDGSSQVFQHVSVHHEKPHCTSRQVYKNILSGKSVAEYDSLVHVWRGADQSDSQQLDKNLLLSHQARAFSRPQLKIDADDIKANHGAATGQLEQNELFYLRSRGLSKDAARFLITYGFAEEVLGRIPHAALRKELEDFAAAQIKRMTMTLSS